MPTRRDVLAGLGAAVSLPLIGSAVSTCLPLPFGSVTGETGSINGWPANFADGTAIKDGVSGQWQWYAMLSSHVGVGDRYRRAETVRGEKWLLLTMIGWRLNGNYFTETTPPPPCSPEVPLTFQLDTTSGGTVYAQYFDGNGYELSGNYLSHGTTSKCHQSADPPTAGTVTYTTFTDAVIEGSYSLDVGPDHVAGAFSAPRCDFTGCPPRPTTKTCVVA